MRTRGAPRTWLPTTTGASAQERQLNVALELWRADWRLVRVVKREMGGRDGLALRNRSLIEHEARLLLVRQLKADVGLRGAVQRGNRGRGGDCLPQRGSSVRVRRCRFLGRCVRGVVGRGVRRVFERRAHERGGQRRVRGRRGRGRTGRSRTRRGGSRGGGVEPAVPRREGRPLVSVHRDGRAERVLQHAPRLHRLRR